MKHFLIITAFLCETTVAFGAPCLPGSLQAYINLGADGCELGTAFVNNFTNEPGLGSAISADPALIQVTPLGSALTFSGTLAAGPGELFQSFFRLNVASLFTGASLTLNDATAAGDGVVTGILDVCSGGTYSGPGPVGCTGTADSAVAAMFADAVFPAPSLGFPSSGFFDVFVDLTADGGLNGNATFTSASLGLQAVPEPGVAWLMGVGLAGIAIKRARCKYVGGLL